MALFKKTTVTNYIGSDVLTVIGPEAFFHGSITVRGSVRVDGEMEGNVSEAHEVVVGTTGKVRGNVSADSVEIGGEVHGDVTCLVRLEIKAGGKVMGNVRSPKILIEEGAWFEGQCSMSETASSVIAGKETS
ncbi:MAG: polymer-forming cytoskeletal protein [Elusimicrobia bacterium]|nr:polymer-forming cytoskeletal protein [Elusimicrobiota bacterium]